MKKNILLLTLILTVSACSTFDNFWTGLFGKEKYQPIPSAKRAPLLNQYSAVPNSPQFSAPLPPAMPMPMPAAGGPPIPEAPDPFANDDLQFIKPPAAAPQQTTPQLVDQYANADLPANRRPPEFNRNIMGDAPVPASVSSVASAPLVPQKLPELPEIGDYPKLAQIPPQQSAPTPLKDDPRVKELQQQMAEIKSAEPAQLASAPPPPKRPIDLDEPKPIPTPKVAREDVGGNVYVPSRRAPAAQAGFADADAPSTDFRSLKPLPEPIDETAGGIGMADASTDYTRLRPVPQRYAPVFDPAVNPYGETIPNNVEILRTARYDKLRKARMSQVREGGVQTTSAVRHSFLD